MGTKGSNDLPWDEIGGVLIVMSCLGMIAFGRETATVQSVLLTVIGFMFGKHKRKSRKR